MKTTLCLVFSCAFVSCVGREAQGRPARPSTPLTLEETLLAFDQSVGGPSDTVREGDIIEAHSTLFEAVARGDCEHESPDCEVIVKHRLLAKGDIAPRPDWPRMESHEEVALVGLDLERRCEWSLVARSRSGVAAEKAFNDALATARTEAGKIIAAARADIQKDLDAATAKADVEISTKAAESEKRLAEIRDGALEAVEAVAKDTAKEIVAGLGGTADARTVNAAVAARLKG